MAQRIPTVFHMKGDKGKEGGGKTSHTDGRNNQLIPDLFFCRILQELDINHARLAPAMLMSSASANVASPFYRSDRNKPGGRNGFRLMATNGNERSSFSSTRRRVAAVNNYIFLSIMSVSYFQLGLHLRADSALSIIYCLSLNNTELKRSLTPLVLNGPVSSSPAAKTRFYF